MKQPTFTYEHVIGLLCFEIYIENIVERKETAPQQFLPLSTIFCYLVLHFYVETMIRFSLRDKRSFEIIEVEITRTDCMSYKYVS